MLIISIVLFVLFAGIAMLWMSNKMKYDDFIGPLGVLVTFLGVIAVFVLVGTLICGRYEDRADINRFKAVQTTIAEIRKTESLQSALESVSLTNEILTWNAWLVNKQYWNERVLDLWIPDEVMELKPLR